MLRQPQHSQSFQWMKVQGTVLEISSTGGSWLASSHSPHKGAVTQCRPFCSQQTSRSRENSQNQKEPQDSKGYVEELAFLKDEGCLTWEYTTKTPALGRLRQEFYQFKASLGYRLKLSLKKKKMLEGLFSHYLVCKSQGRKETGLWGRVVPMGPLETLSVIWGQGNFPCVC